MQQGCELSPEQAMNKKILIAEDNPDNRQLLEDVVDRFRAYGVTILSADNGAVAYEIALRERPDVILLDLMMPGMDGFELCERIKRDATLINTYIIVVSAKAQVEDRRRAALAGVDEYLTKPFDARTVIERVQKVLGLRPL